MSLKRVLKNKEGNYWDFSNRKLDGIHKICQYPAIMVPEMQKELLSAVISEDPSIKNLFDPFHGSGVTLVEGKELGLLPGGIDINPLASLITKVKLEGISKKKIDRSIKNLRKKLYNPNYDYDEHYFININKWFREDIINSLSKIRKVILEEKCANIRRFYWVSLSAIVRKYCNSRSSTFKLHIKEDLMISSMENRVIGDFISLISKNYEYLPDYSRDKKYYLKTGNSKEKMKEIVDGSVDVICTSPPYGDNQTTVTYGQFSILPLFWIDRKDLGKIDESLLDNFSNIDSMSLGGIKSLAREEYQSRLLDNYLLSITEEKRAKVRRFSYDYFEILLEFSRIIRSKGYLIMTLGNRRVNNQEYPLTEMTEEILSNLGFNLEYKFNRSIPIKRMPIKVSNVEGESVKSMTTEYVLLFKKE